MAMLAMKWLKIHVTLTTAHLLFQVEAALLISDCSLKFVFLLFFFVILMAAKGGPLGYLQHHCNVVGNEMGEPPPFN
jgi:hypothetical protein